MRTDKFLLIVFILVAILGQVIAQPVRFYVYGKRTCPACRELKKVLYSMVGEGSVVFYDLLDNRTYIDELLKIYNMSGLGEPYVPLTVLIVDGRVRAIVSGFRGEAYWEQVVELAEQIDGILLDSGTEMRMVVNRTLEEEVKRIVFHGEVVSRSHATVGALAILPPLLSAAAADSVNPCTFSVFTALLLITVSLSGRRRALGVGLAFIAAVFTAYYLLGLGLIRAMEYIPYLKYFVTALAFGVGALSIVSGYGGEFKSPLPRRFRGVVERMIERSVNPLSAALAGFVVSLTLLPCTSGPYLVATALLSRLRDAWLRYLLLGVYNTIFVLPLVVILLAVTFLSLRLRRLKVWRSKKLSVMEVISGILLILIGIYVLLAL